MKGAVPTANQLVRLSFLALLVVLALPGAARAARVGLATFGDPDYDPSPVDRFIDFRDEEGEGNRLIVTFAARGVRFTDTSADLRGSTTTYGRCRNEGPNTVFCPDVLRWVIRLGDGDDRVAFVDRRPATSRNPADPAHLIDSSEALSRSGANVIDGGPGDDRILGSRRTDTVIPGAGRDQVDAGPGDDRVLDRPDGTRDLLTGGGGFNTIDLTGATRPLTVDLRRGVVRARGDRDRVRGFRRVHGGAGEDRLLGSDAGEALYGGNGRDAIQGGRGDDLLVGDGPKPTRPGADTLDGGLGEDLLDTRDALASADELIACGAGQDRVTSDAVDLLSASCESAIVRVEGRRPIVASDGFPLYDGLVSARPVARAADGSPVFQLRCPVSGDDVEACSGTLAVERPGTDAAPGELLAGGSFYLLAGGAALIGTSLTPAGAVAFEARGAPVTVRVSGEVSFAAYSSSGGYNAPLGFAWSTTP